MRAEYEHSAGTGILCRELKWREAQAGTLEFSIHCYARKDFRYPGETSVKIHYGRNRNECRNGQLHAVRPSLADPTAFFWGEGANLALGPSLGYPQN